MEFRILGPVECKAHDARVDVGHLKQRTVLAALLVDAGQPVTQELLINRVWDGCPPATVRNTLYTYLARLRRILTSAPGAAGTCLVRRCGGYLLDVDPEMVDAHRFGRLMAEAQAPGASEERRFELASRALAEFSAVPLTGLTCQWAARVREHFVRRRRVILGLQAMLAIRLGRAALVVDGLYATLVEQPLAEDLAGTLMSALYFSGRSAEALGLFASTRAAIAAELGVEPGPELRRTHEEILRGELARPALRALREGSPYLPQAGVPQHVGEDHPAVPAPGTLPAGTPFHAGLRAEPPEANRARGTAGGARRTRAPAVPPVSPSGREKTVLPIHGAQPGSATHLDGRLPAGRAAAPADAHGLHLSAPRRGSS
jgi:DNA-binding SARP family transcriptional activator